MRGNLALAIVVAAIALALVCAAPARAGTDTPRDATRSEMVERFCGRNAKCKMVARAEVASGRTVQGVIVAMGESILDRNWVNSDRAYDAMTRALLFTFDFMSAAELQMGQINYGGDRAESLRAILGDSAWVCDVRGAFPSKYICLHRRLVAFEPGWPPVSAAAAREP